MRATGHGTCVACNKPYGLGDRIEQDGMDDMGTPRQRWRILHTTCRALLDRPNGSE